MSAILGNISSLYSKKYVWAVVLISLVAFYLAYYYFMEIFAPINGLLCASIWFAFVNFVDDKAFKGVNTYEEIIVQKNMPYAVYFLGICIGSAIAFAVGAFVLIASR